MLKPNLSERQAPKDGAQIVEGWLLIQQINKYPNRMLPGVGLPVWTLHLDDGSQILALECLKGVAPHHK